MRERLRSCLRVAAMTLIAGLVLSAPAQAASPWAVGFDIVIVRPLGFASAVVGAAFYPIAVLVSLPNGPEGREEAWGIFVTAPMQRVFERPLGDF